MMENICYLTDIRGRVVARGRKITDRVGVAEQHCKVILDAIDDPTADVFNDVSDKKLGDCNLGDVLVWANVLMKK